MKKYFVIIIFIFLIIIINLTIISEDKSIIEVNNNYNELDNIPTYENIIKINNSILNKYESFSNILESASIELPLENYYIPQGIAYIDNYIFITYYKDNVYSLVYVLDLGGNIINAVTLDIKSHVGGIAYDNVNNLIYIPNGYLLNVYNKDDFFNYDNVTSIYSFNNLSNGLTYYLDTSIDEIASVAYYKGCLYIGSFLPHEKCTIKKYKINYIDNNIELEYISSFKLPSKVQAITFIEYNNKTYLVVNKSYNRRQASHINIYEYDESILDYTSEYLINTYKLPPMLEGITYNKEDVYIIFESSASKYKNSIDKIKYICVLDFNKMIKY